MGYREIAKQMGISKSVAHEAYKRTLRHGMDDLEVSEHRAEQLSRLDRLYERLSVIVWDPKADNSEVIRAVAEARKVSHRTASLLGLDAPKRIEIEGLATNPVNEYAKSVIAGLPDVENAEELLALIDQQ